MVYKVKLDVFEGPFDLLVYLIENAEMSIYDIQVSEITNQYIEYMERIRKMDAALAGEFMVLAASLIEIKSKMLLPSMKPENDEELSEDPRNELVQKLLEYKRYKKVAAYLEEQEEENRKIYTKPQEDLSVYTKNPDCFLNIDLGQFIQSFHLFLEKQKRMQEVKNRYDTTKPQKMTIETRIKQLKEIFKRKRKIKFQELLNAEANRYHVVLTFLSMLELMRQKSIQAYQTVNFGEITVVCSETESQEEKGA
jgi:segregation and condensation protein A